MTNGEQDLNQRFPNLFGPNRWGDLICQFELVDGPPLAEVIGNVNIVPFFGDKCLITRLRDGSFGIPGGTLEPEEHYWAAMTRELTEELGARALTFEPLGAWHCRSLSERPYREHTPHPDFDRFVGYGNVEVFGAPTSPEDGEDVVAVEILPVHEAHDRFVHMGRPEIGELYVLAAIIRSIKGEGSSTEAMDS